MIEPKTKQYIDEMLDTVKETAYYSEINNKVLDIVFESHTRRCENEGIEYTSVINHQDFSFMSFKDACTLFSNALDNAFDACQSIVSHNRAGFIHLSISRRNQVILVKIVNAKEQNIHLHGSQLRTSKLNASEHGHGMKNMLAIARAYNGDLVYEYDESMFTLLITLTYPLREL